MHGEATPTAAPRGADTPALASCVGDPRRFLEQHWSATPAHFPAISATGFAEVLSLSDTDTLISTGRNRLADLALFKDGHVLDAATYTDQSPGAGGDRLVDVGQVYDYFHRGATIKLQGVHQRWPPLGALCRQLELEMAMAVQANVYVTPPGGRGLDQHFDHHDVLVLHVHGAKRWRVHEPPVVHPVEAHQGRVDPESTALVLDVELQAGDSLYVPRGCPHDVAASAGGAVHVTLGFVVPTWLECFGALLERAVADPTLRETPPPGFAWGGPPATAALVPHLRALIDWLEDLDPDDAASWLGEWMWSRRPLPLSGQLAKLLALDAIDDDSLIGRRCDSLAVVTVEDDNATLMLGDRSVQMPAHLAPALRWVTGENRWRVRELGPLLDEASRLVFVRRLVREGLLEVLETTAGADQSSSST